MSAILPPGERVRRAVAWIIAERQIRPSASLTDLLDEAGMRFSLSPLESRDLYTIFADPEQRGV